MGWVGSLLALYRCGVSPRPPKTQRNVPAHPWQFENVWRTNCHCHMTARKTDMVRNLDVGQEGRKTIEGNVIRGSAVVRALP